MSQSKGCKTKSDVRASESSSGVRNALVQCTCAIQSESGIELEQLVKQIQRYVAVKGQLCALTST